MAKMKSLLALGLFTVLLGGSLALFSSAQAAYAATAPDPGTEVSSVDQDVCSGASACNAFIDKYINPFIALLSGLVGVIAVISIIMAGIQYASSADDPAAVSKAKHRILNTIIGLLAYIFLFAFLEYLIPGGLL